MSVSVAGRCARGLTLIEAVICMVIVGGLLVAAMRALGMSGTLTADAAARRTAKMLAGDLLGEIRSMPYTDTKEPVVGALENRVGGIDVSPDVPEPGAARAAFDSVDDYDGLVDSPPTDRQGRALPVSEAFERSVEVAFVTLADPSAVAASDTGLKRITVTVSRSGVPVFSLSALRAAAWPPVVYQP